MKYLISIILFFATFSAANAQDGYKEGYKAAQKEGSTWVIILSMDG